MELVDRNVDVAQDGLGVLKEKAKPRNERLRAVVYRRDRPKLRGYTTLQVRRPLDGSEGMSPSASSIPVGMM